MKIRTAKKLFKRVDNSWLSNVPRHVVADVLGIVSKFPDWVAEQIEKEYETTFWGGKYLITPRVIRRRFGDGRYWATFSPLNTRPNYYVLMGDSQWSKPERFRDDLELIYETIENQYGNRDWCECEDGVCEEKHWNWIGRNWRPKEHSRFSSVN